MAKLYRILNISFLLGIYERKMSIHVTEKNQAEQTQLKQQKATTKPLARCFCYRWTVIL